ncbi:hypothetical protein I314_02554 [Cryptococcus bacillisporus CA1873]|uniref:Uncharacterized protein n=1 Tax=Cryptococcus bacillisporus CA1873 TaxID=1296111 RepID=A0ABR5BDT2_CRYGA|nr:hypothetical protein I314_02554 [Cryptococcus bacillisporus CA1873]|eukprot:KIR67336.1 hypothetical protein I314_02554 [Cryptococcus gattii CA1873]
MMDFSCVLVTSGCVASIKAPDISPNMMSKWLRPQSQHIFTAKMT